MIFKLTLLNSYTNLAKFYYKKSIVKKVVVAKVIPAIKKKENGLDFINLDICILLKKIQFILEEG